MSQVWTIGLADNGRTYLATATYLDDIDAWGVVLYVDNEPRQMVPTDDPCLVALRLIAEAQAAINGSG